MHRRGHVGIALLAYAPAGYLLLKANRPAIALLGAIAVLLIEPIPDNDFWIPWLSHRGTSHSLFCALLMGLVLGGVGWFAGNSLTDAFANLLAGGDLSTVGIFAGVFNWLATYTRTLDGALLAEFGFVVGVSGIVVHLLGDIITVSGIRPFLPLSRRRISLSGLRADSTLANSGFLVLGVLAIALVLFTTAPGISASGEIGALSPGVAAAQETPANATLDLGNQTTNGSTIVIDAVTLPKGGFVVIHGQMYLEGIGGPAAIAVSGPLDPGTHRNVTVTLTNGVPGSSEPAQPMRESAVVAAVAYRDTNGNGAFDYYRPDSTADAPYGNETRSVGDSAFITVKGSRADVATQEPLTPGIEISDQRIEGNSVVVDSATLPRGGFIAIHDQTYLPPNSRPVSSTVGVTNYLEPGTHRNVTVPVLPSALNRSQTVIAVPHHDTNTNRTFDFVVDRAREDIAYVQGENLVTARAQVTVPGQSAPTSISTRGTSSPATASPTDRPATAISIGLNNANRTTTRVTISTTARPTATDGSASSTSATDMSPATRLTPTDTESTTSSTAGSAPFSGLPLSPTNLLVVVLLIALGAVFVVRS